MSKIEFVNECGVTLIQSNASDDMVAMAAWVSNDADSEERLKDRDKVAGLINFLYKNRHMSPFEHGSFTIKVDVPLFVAREFHRHRTMSYNEVSGRYTEMKPRFWAGNTARVQQGKMGNYYFVDGSDEQTAIYLQTKRKDAKMAWKTYQERLAAGMAKEQAREELPLSLMTQFYFTVNPRNLMQFLSLRNDKHALKEIRDVAVKIEEIFAQQMPLTYNAYLKGRELEETSKEDLLAQNSRLQAQIDELQYQNRHLATQNCEWEGKAYALDKKCNELSKSLDETRAERDLCNAEYNRKFVESQENSHDQKFDINLVLDSMTSNKDILATIERIRKELNTIRGRERK